MSKFDFKCTRCGGIVLSDEVCPHKNCQDCQDFCCRENSRIDLRRLAAFAVAMSAMRQRFPENAAEIDRAVYDVGQKLESCQKTGCSCRETFESFHERANQNAARRKTSEFN